MSKYQVKNVKTFRGMEGYGFNATLYRDNKRVALVDDDAHGGCYRYSWLDFKAPRVEITIKNWEGKDWTMKVTPEEKAFMEHVRSQTTETCEPEDTFVAGLVDHFEEMKQYKKWCRKETVFRLKGDKEGHWRTVALPFSDPRAKKYLQDKYGAKVEEILNEKIA